MKMKPFTWDSYKIFLIGFCTAGVFFSVALHFTDNKVVLNKPHEVDTRVCVQACRKSEFQGLYTVRDPQIQGTINPDLWSKVNQWCENFYKGKKCCEDSTRKNLKNTHDWTNGECK